MMQSNNINESNTLEDDDTDDTHQIDLGFVEPFEHRWMREPRYFPMKVGGKPAFLSMSPVLGAPELCCKICDTMMRFIMQVYAPITDRDDCFHRTLFVFACGATGECAQTQFVVYRSQLAKVNAFYSPQSPNYDKDDKSVKNPKPSDYGIELCKICGVAAKFNRKPSYCSEWHKKVDELGNNTRSMIFPEYELIIEPFKPSTDKKRLSNESDDDDDDGNDDDEKKQNESMNRFYEYLQTKRPALQNENLDSYAGISKVDNSGENRTETDEFDEAEQKTFDRFKRESREGEVIRYRVDWYKVENPSDDDILWISNRNRLSMFQAITNDNNHNEDVKSENNVKHVPPCERCGASRKFEFQIMPQLLNKLLHLTNEKQSTSSSGEKSHNRNKTTTINEDNEYLDWGTLLVFSCANSCSTEVGPSKENNNIDVPMSLYVPEFIYNQPIS